MTTSTDERRARAVHSGAYEAGVVDESYDDMPENDRAICLVIARAIRASDEAAGMMLVKRNAEDPDEPMSWDEWLKAQATETPNG